MIKVIQIAAILVRRTRSFVSTNQSYKKGDKLGQILLGSQVAFMFPKKNLELNVKKGDRVSSGETVICQLK